MTGKSNQSQGFTLVELMIVVAIIGILSMIAVPAYFNHILRTRQTNGVQKLIDMKTAQEKYYALYDRYAPTEANTNYKSMLSFDIADTTYYTFGTVGGATTFTAQIDGNNAYLNNDRWIITGPWAEPSQTSEPDGFSFSMLGDLFN